MSPDFDRLFDTLLRAGLELEKTMDPAEVENAFTATGFALVQERLGTTAACDVLAKALFKVRNGPLLPPRAAQDG